MIPVISYFLFLATFVCSVFLVAMLSSPVLISLVFPSTMLLLFMSLLQLLFDSLLFLFFLRQFLLDIFQLFDCFGNKVDLCDANFLLLDVTSAIDMVLFVISFYVTEKSAFFILAWACYTATLVDPVWVYFALTFPAASSLGAFTNTFASARTALSLSELQNVIHLPPNLDLKIPPSSFQNFTKMKKKSLFISSNVLIDLFTIYQDRLRVFKKQLPKI